MDSSASQDTGRNGARRSGKRAPQMKFMFIDSTSHGTNAKPNKAVRSFVMHQARRSKPWSTRQRQPSSPNAEEASPTEESSSASQTHSTADELSPVGAGGRQQVDLTWSTHSGGSPVSSGSSIRSNSRSGSQPCVSPTSSDDSVHDLLHGTGKAYHQTQTALTRRDGFALGVLDPFDSFPVRVDAKTSSLLDHFVSFISPRLIPVDLHRSSQVATTRWVARSLGESTSAPFTYALLTSSALHLQAFGGAQLQDVLQYKSKAIKEINNLLQDSQLGVDDNNIAAVFMLLCLEESQLAPGSQTGEDAEWSERQRAIHLNGLRTMIEQRGGLAALSSNRCLQTFILMHSIAHSISTFHQPYSTLLDSTGQPQKYDIPSFRQRPASARVLRLFRDLKLDADLLEIISHIIVYVGDMTSWFEDKKCPLDPLELQKHGCLLNYRLYKWYSDPSQGGPEEKSPIDQSICLAMIIFLVKAYSPYDPSYRAIVLTSMGRLRAALSKGSIFRWAKSPDLLLWTLTMGALAAQGSTDASFFSHYSSVAFADAGFDDKTSADELLDRMKKLIWIPMLFDDEVSSLWVHMGIVKGESPSNEVDNLGSPEIKEDDVVGLLTSTRFFPGEKK